MARFLFLALTLLVLTLAAGQGLLTELGGIDFGSLAPQVRVGTWALEAIALTALFLLIHGEIGRPKDPEGSPVVSGVLATWIAWVFRGALLVLSLAAAGQSTTIWWRRALGWWAIYTVCGIVLGLLARTPKKIETSAAVQAERAVPEASRPESPALPSATPLSDPAESSTAPEVAEPS